MTRLKKLKTVKNYRNYLPKNRNKEMINSDT